MEFINKAETFIAQLQNSMAIEPEPILDHEKGFSSLMLEPSIFNELLEKYHIPYPFQADIRIIELKSQMLKDNLSSEDAITILEKFKTFYWIGDIVLIPYEYTQKIETLFKKLNKEITPLELTKANLHFQEYLQEKRANIYSDLIAKLKSIPTVANAEKQVNEIFDFKNNFDDVKPQKVYDYFKAELFEKGYLTEQELKKYLSAAFELKAPPFEKFKLLTIRSKKRIYAVFYKYYREIANDTHSRQREYVALLSNYFAGFNPETVATNWSKGYTPSNKF